MNNYNIIEPWKKDFINGYISCIQRYVKLTCHTDKDYPIDDESILNIHDDCYLFLAKVWRKSAYCYKEILCEASQAGYDFCVECLWNGDSENGFLSGYWPESIQDTLKEIAEEFAPIDIYLNQGTISVEEADVMEALETQIVEHLQ